MEIAPEVEVMAPIESPIVKPIQFRTIHDEKIVNFDTIEELIDRLKKQSTESTLEQPNVWVDITAPTPETLAILEKVFRIIPITTDHITDQISSSEQFDQYPHYLYLCMATSSSDELEEEYVKIILSKYYLLTIHRIFHSESSP